MEKESRGREEQKEIKGMEMREKEKKMREGRRKKYE